MQTFNFTYEGKAVTVEIDFATGHRFFYTLNGNRYNFELKGFENSYTAKTLQISWAESIADSAGTVFKSEAKSYLNPDINRYTALYNVEEFSEIAGDFYAKQCINGIMSRVLGCYCFLPDGTFVDPSA